MGKKRNKKKILGPRRKRLKRDGRLQSGKEWIKTHKGKNIVKSYAKYYAVDPICALTELEMLGIEFTEEIKAEIKRKEANRIHQLQLQKQRRKEKAMLDDYDDDSDEQFAFIAGYTEGGFPFGITHEEMEEIESEEGSLFRTCSSNVVNDEDNDIQMLKDSLELLYSIKQTLVTKLENDNWYSDYFDWDSYFGDLEDIEDCW